MEKSNSQMHLTTKGEAMMIMVILIVVIAIVLVGIYIASVFVPKSALEAQTPTPTTSPTIISPTPTVTQELKIETLTPGTGAVAENGKTVTVNYTGTLENGTVFDSSLKAGREPFSFKLGAGNVIEGWEKGVLGMKVGEKRKLTIPSSMGYGTSGVPGVIPANATLIFEVELLKVE